MVTWPILPLDSWLWHFCENYLYPLPEPPPRVRRAPMQVLGVGISRSGTESLQRALIELGIPTYHGWDLMFERPMRLRHWVRLERKKYYGIADGNAAFTAEDFDCLFGHCQAVVDAPAAKFAPELVAVYPEAKIILNTRDVDKWHRSFLTSIVGSYKSWMFYLASFWERELWWVWHAIFRFAHTHFFHLQNGDLEYGISRVGKWVYRDHCNMIRGLVPKENLLEWTPEDGWEPLCKFLGKDVPNKPFPHVNASGGGRNGYNEKEYEATRRWVFKAFTNFLFILASAAGLCVTMCYKFRA